MAEVQPIRNVKQIKGMCNNLKMIDYKYYIMFIIGIETGMRVSDILKLRVSDIDKMSSKKIKEKKTGKQRFLFLNDKTTREIKDYIKEKGLSEDDYLIPSRKHDKDGNQIPVSRIQAYRVLNEAGEAVGVDQVGTHTMRKSFGYHYYKKTRDVVPLMRIFNHASQAITLRYIGIEDAEIQNSLEDFILF